MDPNEPSIAVELAEAELHRLGLGHVRVREHGGVACMDLPAGEVFGIVSEPLRGEVLRAIRGAGFDRVALYLDGDDAADHSV